ncbi:InlB B-repeat-containing protein [Candidatus Saccharibacteria bacterium]|nr:InlB B-repeat-containing protein [Candidatus Saccharibacteria bacterium]
MVEYDDDHNVASGEYKEPVLNNPTVADWYWSTDEEGKNELNLSDVTSDITAYAQYRKVQWKFGYTGDIQSYIVPYEKRMLYEVWGAQGGDYVNGGNAYPGGAGGYSRGYLTRNLDDQLYIVNGQKGITGIGYAYNGGGPSTSSVVGSGGGATHIALESGLLSEFKEKKDKIVMVAGAGGGLNKQTTPNLLEKEVANQHSAGGTGGGDNSAGGGYWGNDGYANYRGRGGDQENPGPKAFGNVGALRRNSDFGLGGGAENGSGGNEGGGGGAGWYGGSGAGWGIGGSGGGGSGYVGYSDLYLAKMYGLRVAESDVAGQITISTTNYSEEPVSRYAKTGDGFTMVSINQARIVFKWGNQEDFKLRYWGDTVDDSGIDSDIDGYTFLGWFIGDKEYDFSTPIEEDIVLTAKYKINTYNIDYDISNGDLPESNPATYTVESDDITLNNPTAPEYYEFLGWSGTNLTGGENLTVTIPKGSFGNREYAANIKPIQYSIDYELNGGSGSSSYPTTYNYESPEIALTDPVKEGHIFLGWSGTDLDGGKNLNVVIPAQSHGDREYTANWSINQYTASFDANAGETADPERITKNFGEELGALPATARSGYRFLGWFTEQTGGTKISDTTTMPAENHTYYAHWEIINYTIEYDLGGEDMDSAPTNDASNPTSYTVEDADITLKAATPGDTWHYFVGWALDHDTEDGLTDNFVIDTAGAKNIKVYAIFQANPYTVTLDPGNGDDEIVKTVRGDQEIGELPTPERAGYEFLGWFVGDKQIEEHFHPRSDSIAIARWAEIPTVPDTGANSTPNTGDAIMNHIVAFAACAFALFIVMALRKRKAKNEA